MAVDTAAKRFSMMDMTVPMQPGMDPPDNAVVAKDRLTLLWLYNGIAAAVPAVSGAAYRKLSIGIGISL